MSPITARRNAARTRASCSGLPATAWRERIEWKERKTGRGERIRADTTSRLLLIPVTNVPSYVCRASETA